MDRRSSWMRIKFHNWWSAPKVWAQVQAIDPVASHASWMENFPWTRLANVKGPRPEADERFGETSPTRSRISREYLKDGNYGGLYQRDDEEVMKIWRTGRGGNARVTERGLELTCLSC